MKTKEELLAKEETLGRYGSRAVFYAVLYSEFRKAAIECGYTLALHGSMAKDMDLIAVAWTEEATDPKVLVSKISDLIGDTVWRDHHLKRCFKGKPHGRIVYTLTIMGDWYLDLSMIPPKKKHKKKI